MTDRIELVVFDMAGTTVSDNQDVAKAFQKAFATIGVDVPIQTIQPLMGYHKPVAIRMLMRLLALPVNEKEVELVHVSFNQYMTDFYTHDPSVKPMAGAEELFTWLHEQGMQVALNTGFSRDLAGIIIKRFNWIERGLVNHFTGSDEVPEGRPQPHMIHRLMSLAGVSDPLAVVKVGDTSVDIEEGRNAGCCYLIGVTTGAFTEEALEVSCPTNIVDHLHEIPRIISQHAY